jgi:hypothetical protein
MLNNLGLGILLEAKDEFSTVMEKAKHQFHATEKAAEDLATGSALHLGKWALGLAAVAGAAVAAGTAIAYGFAHEAAEGSLTLAQAGARAGATAEQLEELRKAADDVGLRGIGVTADEAAQDLKMLITNGMGAEGAIEALNASVLLAKASFGELAGPQAAQAVASILKEFHLTAADATPTVDKMAVAMRMFGVSAADIVPMVTGVARGAELAGANFNDALAAVGLAKKVLPDAGQAIMGVNMALSGLAGGAARAKLAGLGVSAKDAATGGMKPLLTILAELDARMGSLSEGDKAEKIGKVFGPRGAGTMVAIMGELSRGVRSASGEMVYGAKAAAEIGKQMNGAGGAAQAMTESVAEEMGTQENRLRANFANMVDFIGGPLTKVFAPALMLLNLAIKDLNREIVEGNGFWGRFAAAANTVGLVFQGLVQLFDQGGFSGKVREEMDKAENSGIKKFAVQVWHWVGVIQNAWEGFMNGWDNTMEKLQPTFDRLLLAWKGIGIALGLADDSAEGNAATWDTFGDVAAYVGTLLAWVAGILAEKVAFEFRVATTLIGIFREAWEVLGPVIKPVLYFLRDGLNLVVAILDGDMKGALQGFAAIALDAIGFVIGMASSLLRILAKTADFVGSLFGADLGLSNSVGRELDQVETSINKFRDDLTGRTVVVAAPEQSPIASMDVGQMSSAAGASTIPVAAMASVIARGPTSSQHAANQSSVSDVQSVGPAVAEIHTHLHLDGEQVAESVRKADLRKRARAFHPIPVGG